MKRKDRGQGQEHSLNTLPQRRRSSNMRATCGSLYCVHRCAQSFPQVRRAGLREAA